MICFVPTMADHKRLTELQLNHEALAADGKDYAGQMVVKPWGSEKSVRSTEHFDAWSLSINPGHETSLHCHLRKTTVLMVERGRILLTTLTGTWTLRIGESALIAPCVFHRLSTPLGAEVTEIEWPPNRNDLVRLEDRYGRQGKGYAHAGG